MYQTEREQREKEPVKTRPAKKQMQVDLHRMVGSSDPEHCEKDPVWCAVDTFSAAFEQTGKALIQGREMKGYSLSQAQKQKGVFLQDFGQIAFQRGTLSLGILQGQGEVMLVSCLQRAYRAAGSDDLKTSLSGAGDRHVALAGGKQMIFHPGEIESAVGVVTKSIQSGRRQLGTLRKAATAEDAPDTLRRVYPFLCAAQEEETRERYQERLRELESTQGDPEELAVLRYGVDRLTAILQKKEQQRQQFLTRLGELLSKACEAEKTFSQEDFVRRIHSDILQEEVEETPTDPQVIGLTEK